MGSGALATASLWLTPGALADSVAFFELWAITTLPALDAVLATFIMVTKKV